MRRPATHIHMGQGAGGYIGAPAAGAEQRNRVSKDIGCVLSEYLILKNVLNKNVFGKERERVGPTFGGQ